MAARTDYIAVFDSGLGGISVLRHLRQRMPGERYLYFGDSANAPYGSRSTDEVRALTMAAVEKLMAQKPLKALVLACNTATAAAVKDLRKRYPELIVIGIEPALKLAADNFPGGRIGVMATEVTLREEKFDALLHRFDESCTVTKIPVPGLVQLVEAGKTEGEEVEALLRVRLADCIGKLDAVVLGCTHYPLAAKVYGETAKALAEVEAKSIDKLVFGMDVTDPATAAVLPENADEIELVGLVSNICVVSNAVVLQSKYPEATILVDAQCTDSFDKGLHEKVLDVLAGFQVSVINR